MNTRIKLNEYGDIEYCYIWLAIVCGATLVHVFGVFYISQMSLRNPCLALTKTT